MQKMLILPALAAITLGLSQGAMAQDQDGPTGGPPPECRQDQGRCVAPDGPPPQGGRHPDAPRGERMQKREHSRDTARNGADQRPDRGVRHDAQAPRDASGQAPRPGDDARGSPSFRRAENSSFAAPGAGQELRVMDDAVVLVDSRTQRVQDVLGAVPAQR